ncbi:MAG TPA: pro-sigmaK processing inhibitor BofA family protein [Syntrophomonadaceae bacterium]|nr:pro-sigmaK processing inhibitor BofA [Syntrophomonadaceae bacterium]HOQ10604.1 pro-sigmaK processing inhibitor BofA family protein [Syntrophomonadaceae bacterium]HPU49742.1 pro-sigmaK processing inhibitor BofA family protein [Syntrophomonadaceae bacterium]
MEVVNVIMAALFLLVILYLIAQVFMKPIKLLWKLLFNSAVGLILLLLANYIGGYLHFSLPINIITVLIAGFLGLPGILLLVCFQLLMM